MQAQESTKMRFCSILHSAFCAFVAGIFLLAVLFMVSIFTWGHNQALTPEMIRERLRMGLLPVEAEDALGIAPGSVSQHLVRRKDGTSYAMVSDSGIVGAWFVPQYAIALVFDANGKLSGCVAEIHWRADEEPVTCDLQETRTAQVKERPAP